MRHVQLAYREHYVGKPRSNDGAIWCRVQGVTTGIRYRDSSNVEPLIGDRVVIGAGVKLLGSIRGGNDALVGGNSVVIDDIHSD